VTIAEIPPADYRKLYFVWAMIKQRCLNPKCRIWPWYGGAGVTVCAEWAGRTAASGFIAWALAAGWQPGLHIDRIDPIGPYAPGNCRFVTRTENLRNRRWTPKWAAHLARCRELSTAARRARAEQHKPTF